MALKLKSIKYFFAAILMVSLVYSADLSSASAKDVKEAKDEEKAQKNADLNTPKKELKDAKKKKRKNMKLEDNAGKNQEKIDALTKKIV